AGDSPASAFAALGAPGAGGVLPRFPRGRDTPEFFGPDSPPMTDPAPSLGLYGPLLASAAMRAILADSARVQRMLDVEAALARAEAAAGVVPNQTVAPSEAPRRA